MNPPPAAVVESFGLHGTPRPLDGGRGLCYILNQVVFKPSENDSEAQWILGMIDHLDGLSKIDYRVPKPISLIEHPGTFVSSGWTASQYLQGSASEDRFEEKIKTCRAFHVHLSSIVRQKPDAIGKEPNRFNLADRVTWGELKLEETPGVNKTVLAQLHPLLNYLGQVWRLLPSAAPDQLIHGDLSGNILFDDDSGRPPAVIDFTFYWRPADYATAIVVADGLIWRGEGGELVEMYGTDEVRLQLLVRASYWRCVTFAIESDLVWIQANLPKAGFLHVIEVLRTFLGEG